MKKTKKKSARKYASGGKVQFENSREMDDYGADRTRGFKKGGRVQTRGSGCAISGNTHKG